MRLFLALGCLLCSLLLLAPTRLQAQSNVTISGQVTDVDDGEPLIGVNILVKDKVIGTVTNADGNFSFTVNESLPLTLVVTSVGYGREEVVVDSQTDNLSIELAYQTLLGQEWWCRLPG